MPNHVRECAVWSRRQRSLTRTKKNALLSAQREAALGCRSTRRRPAERSMAKLTAHDLTSGRLTTHDDGRSSCPTAREVKQQDGGACERTTADDERRMARTRPSTGSASASSVRAKQSADVGRTHRIPWYMTSLLGTTARVGNSHLPHRASEATRSLPRAPLRRCASMGGAPADALGRLAAAPG